MGLSTASKEAQRRKHVSLSVVATEDNRENSVLCKNNPELEVLNSRLGFSI